MSAAGKNCQVTIFFLALELFTFRSLNPINQGKASFYTTHYVRTVSTCKRNCINFEIWLPDKRIRIKRVEISIVFFCIFCMMRCFFVCINVTLCTIAYKCHWGYCKPNMGHSIFASLTMNTNIDGKKEKKEKFLAHFSSSYLVKMMVKKPSFPTVHYYVHMCE